MLTLLRDDVNIVNVSAPLVVRRFLQMW